MRVHTLSVPIWEFPNIRLMTYFTVQLTVAWINYSIPGHAPIIYPNPPLLYTVKTQQKYIAYAIEWYEEAKLFYMHISNTSVSRYQYLCLIQYLSKTFDIRFFKTNRLFQSISVFFSISGLICDTSHRTTRWEKIIKFLVVRHDLEVVTTVKRMFCASRIYDRKKQNIYHLLNILYSNISVYYFGFESSWFPMTSFEIKMINQSPPLVRSR